MSVTEPVLEPWSLSRPPGVLAFACPCCHGPLTLPATLANAEGPCPLCREVIIGPDPERGLEARVASGADPETVPIRCGACATPLEVDLGATAGGGPCPACGTWIQLDGQLAETASRAPWNLDSPGGLAEPEHASSGVEPLVFDEGPAEFEVPLLSPQSPVRVAFPQDDSEGDFPRGEAPWQPWSFSEEAAAEMPRDVPPLHPTEAAGAETAGFPSAPGTPAEAFDVPGSAARDRSSAVPSPPARSGRKTSSSAPVRLPWWVLVMTTILSLGISLAVAAKFDLIDWENLRFWDRALPASAPVPVSAPAREAAEPVSGGGMPEPTPLHEDISRHAQALAAREARSFEAARLSLERFLSAPSWEGAREELLIAFPASEEETLAALKGFPRDALLGRDFELLEGKVRILGTERYLFPLRLVPLDPKTEAEALPLFFLLEENEAGRFHIHAEHLLQTWRERLSHFLKTPGAAPGRFYLWVALGKGLLADEAAIVLPDGNHAKVRLLDYFSRNNQHQSTGYVNTDSPAGLVLLSKINEAQWKAAVLELAWKQGPRGDTFIEITSLIPSNWGEFVK